MKDLTKEFGCTHKKAQEVLLLWIASFDTEVV